MKRILFGVLLCLLMATPALAVDTFIETTQCYGNPQDVCIYTLEWREGAADSDGISKPMSDSEFQKFKGYFAYPIITIPGTPSPTDNYDLTIMDGNLDLCGGLCANRHTTSTQRIVPKVDETNSIYGGNPLLSAPVFTITDASQNVQAASGKIILVLWRN